MINSGDRVLCEPSGMGIDVLSEHQLGLLRQMVKSSSGDPVATHWSVLYRSGGESCSEEAASVSGSVTLFEITGVSTTLIGEIAAIRLKPSGGSLCCERCGAVDGTGGGDVSDNAIDIILSGEVGEF